MQLLTVEQTAEILAVSITTVRARLEQLGAVDLTHGKGKKRMIRIPEDSLNRYIRDCSICKEPEKKRTKSTNTTWHIERRKA